MKLDLKIPNKHFSIYLKKPGTGHENVNLIVQGDQRIGGYFQCAIPVHVLLVPEFQEAKEPQGSRLNNEH